MTTRRQFLLTLPALALLPRSAFAAQSIGEHLVAAAKNQIGLTRSYDPGWSKIPYPNGDVPRTTGVCADVVIRAARDAFSLDLQKLVHEDISRNFSAYPSQKTWGNHHPDPNIDHRRVLNLECYWQRQGSQLWHATGKVAGDKFPSPLELGDLLTWLINGRLPHVAILAQTNPLRVVHNIGNGTELCDLVAFQPHLAVGHYRWPLKLPA